MPSGRVKRWELSDERLAELRSRVLSERGDRLAEEFGLPYYVITNLRHAEEERRRKEAKAEAARKAQEERRLEIQKAELFAQKRFEDYGYRFEELSGEERVIYLRGPKHRLEGKVLVTEKGA